MAVQSSSPLWSWFADRFLPWLSSLASSLLQGFFSYYTWFYGTLWFWISAIILLLEGILWSIETVAESWTVLRDLFPQLIGPDSSMLVYGAFINRFVPLQESFAVAALIFNIWLVLTIGRWFKSFLPTIAN